MLTQEEEKFLHHWEKNRLSEKTLAKQLALGLPLAFLIGIGIILNYISGWYTRATMVANSQSTPLVLIVAIIVIALFCSIFFKKHQWEMNEQRYLELKAKSESENSSQPMQQQEENDSQISN